MIFLAWRLDRKTTKKIVRKERFLKVKMLGRALNQETKEGALDQKMLGELVKRLEERTLGRKNTKMTPSAVRVLLSDVTVNLETGSVYIGNRETEYSAKNILPGKLRESIWRLLKPTLGIRSKEEQGMWRLVEDRIQGWLEIDGYIKECMERELPLSEVSKLWLLPRVIEDLGGKPTEEDLSRVLANIAQSSENRAGNPVYIKVIGEKRIRYEIPFIGEPPRIHYLRRAVETLARKKVTIKSAG